MRPIIVDSIQKVVQRVHSELIERFQEIDPTITGVHYMHGHPIEIINNLGKKDKSNNLMFDKYPLVALFQDFGERSTRDFGISEATFTLIIAKATRPDYVAEERYEHNFKPFLYPIYESLLKWIEKSGEFLVYDKNLIQHEKIDRLFWGNSGLYGSKANIFNDWIDAIEVKNMRLRFYNKVC